MPAKAKLSDEQVKKIGRRVGKGEFLTDLAVEYDVNRKTLRRRLAASELADAERARRTAAKRAEQKRMQRLLGPNYRNPDRAPEHRPAIPGQAGEGADPRPSSQRSSQISTATGFDRVPIFPHTREGLLERLAYYDARKLNNLPTSLLDYHDVIHGRETPDERRARQARATGRKR